MGLRYQSLLHDLGVDSKLRVWTDSTATMCICWRQGLGKLRRIDTQRLWIQQRVRDGTFELSKIPGEEDPADFFTKLLAFLRRRQPSGRGQVLVRPRGSNWW